MTTAHDNSNKPLDIISGPGKVDILASLAYADDKDWRLRQGHEVTFEVVLDIVGRTAGPIETSLNILRTAEVRGAVEMIERGKSSGIPLPEREAYGLRINVTSIDVKDMTRQNKHYDLKGYGLQLWYNPQKRRGYVSQAEVRNLRRYLRH